MEPATKQDLKDLLKEFREEFRGSIREVVAEAFGNRKPAHSVVVASDGDLTVDPTIVAVVPDISSSTTNDQEVLEVVHDAFSDCIATAPVTCSTYCSTQVVATASMPAPTPAATPTAPSTTAHIFPELMDSAVSAGPFDIDAIRSDAVVPAMVVSSNPGKYAVVEAHPDVPTATAAVLRPWVLLKDRDMDVSKPTACSRFCLPNTAMLPLMATAFPQASQQRLMLRPTPWPSFWMLLAHENEVRPMPWPSFSCSHEGMTLNQEGLLPQVTCVMKNLLDRGCIDFTLGKAALPRFHIGNSAYSSKQIGDLLVGRLHVMVKHSGSLQPLSSSAEVPYWFDYFISRSPQIPHSMYCQFELELKPSWLQKYLSGGLNSLTAFSRYLPSGQQVKPCIFLKVVRRIPMVPLDILIPSQPILHSMNDLNLGASRWQSVISSVQPSYEFRPEVNHITSLMVVYVCELIPMEEHFSCLQNAQLQSWRPPDGRTYADKLLSQEGCSWTVTQETSCARTVHTHASYLTYIDFINMALIGSEAMHGEHVNYKNVQSYTCCVVQPLKGVEYFVLWVASYEFYLEKFALVRNLEKKGSDNSVLCVVAPVVHSSNTGSFLNVLLLSCLSSVTSSKSCECFHGDKYMEVVQLLAHSVGQLLIGRIHKWGMQSNVLTDSFSLWLDCLEVCSVPAYLILDGHWYVGTGIEHSTLDVYRAGHQPYELISPYHQLDISKLQLGDCNSWWIFLQLHPDYMLLYAMDLLGSDLGIYQQGMSWDPGGLALLLILELTRRATLQGGSGHACLLTMPPSNQRPSKIIMERVICKGTWTMGGMTSSTFFDQEQLQGGRGITIVAAVVVQGSVDHTYYLNFDQDYADNDHFLGASLDGVAIGHGCYNHVIQVNLDFDYHHDFELVKDHRVQWDPGGSQWRRLGVKPNFKEGGMLGALLTWTCTGARPLGQPMDLARL